MTLQAVFFDMGGTIERFWYTPEIRLQATPGLKQLLLSAGINLALNDEKLCDLITIGQLRYHKWSIETNKELPPAHVWADFILRDYPVDQEQLAKRAEDLMCYFEERFYQREMRPDVPKVLDTIRKMGLKIGLISNVCSHGLVPFNLELYGIRHFFNPVVLSSQYGYRKPDPAIFHYAARLANVPTSECVYIGDRVSRDIVGAHKAGFRLAVQIHHDFNHGEVDSGATPDAVITTMDEIIDILQSELHQDIKNSLNGRPFTTDRRAILFDAGDILYHRPDRRQKLFEFLAQIGLDPQDLDEPKRQAAEDQAFCGLISQEQYREIILRSYGVTQPDHIRTGMQILHADDNAVEIFDGVPDTLRLLKERGFLLGIITDTAAPLSVKLKWFEQGGFGNVWDSIISSREVGVRKPDLKIYRAALQQLGVTPDQAVFVGHKASELDGAKAAGMHTIAFNYEESAAADTYIEKFSDLANMLTFHPSETIGEG